MNWKQFKDKTDWELLKEQKEVLVIRRDDLNNMISYITDQIIPENKSDRYGPSNTITNERDVLSGIIHLLDNLQDVVEKENDIV